MTATPSEEHLIHDWADDGTDTPAPQVMLDDETLRDGLQSPSVTDPPIPTKIKILRLMDRLGIETADIGLPGASPRQLEDVRALCREIAESKLRIKANSAARTVISDIAPVVDVVQETGVPIEVCTFIGSSPIRQYAEEWDLDLMLERTVEAVRFAVGEGLEVMYVTEDTVRSQPEHLRLLFTAAIDAGATRLCLCDTVGAAVPKGVRSLVTWVNSLLDELGVGDRVGIDWHGHRDRGLGVSNTIAAAEAGATRVHGTALGVGERVGNTAMEQLLVNFKLLGWRDDDLSALQEYATTASEATGVPIAPSTPIVGSDAFRTATGVHAAAVIKALHKGQDWLADRVYSGVPASWIGRSQRIEIGPMSGSSNVVHFLEAHGLPHDDATVEAVFDFAKKSNRLLTEGEIRAVVGQLVGV